MRSLVFLAILAASPLHPALAVWALCIWYLVTR